MTRECRYSLLDEPLFSVKTPDHERLRLSLPEILERLARDEIASFDCLQSHQRQAWHSFLVQLAVIALARSAEQKVISSASRWKELLLALSDGNEFAWCVVVDDVLQPAFMQSPIPEGSLDKAKYKSDVITPDDLDILVTSKNHDVKMHRISHPRIEHWIYSLVVLQTSEGFLGQGNYGIARMNGGFGNRPLLGMTSSLSWGSRFRRDVAVLVPPRRSLADHYGYDLQGHALLWFMPWDGSEDDALSLSECDPLFIEICRRIRFTLADESPRCWRTNTKSTRVAVPEGVNGTIGDPWTPIDIVNSKALTLGEQGFSYRILHQILFTGSYERPLALEVTNGEKNGAFVIATTLVRGQGKTEGWHQRVVPVPSKGISLFGSATQRQELCDRAQQQVDLASEVQHKVLYPALACLMSADSKGKVDSSRISRWTNAYDADVDDVFFKGLWYSLDVTREEATLHWQEQLLRFARKQLEAAINSTPLPSTRRYRAISRAESIFYWSAHKHLAPLFRNQQQKEEMDHVTSLK